MAVRVTQVVPEILGSGTGKLRLSRQLIEVLVANTGGIDIDVTASSALSLSSQATPTVERELSASSGLSLSDTAEATLGDSVIIPVGTSSSMSLVQTLAHNMKFLTASNLMSLEPSAQAAGEKLLDASNLLELLQESLDNFRLASASSLLSFEQEVQVQQNNDWIVGLSNTLDLQNQVELGNFEYIRRVPEGLYNDDGTFNPGGVPSLGEGLALSHTVVVTGDRNLSIIQTLSLNQVATARQALINQELTSLISFNDFVKRIREGNASSILALTQLGYRVFTASSALGLSHSATAAKAKFGTTTLALSHTLSRLMEYNRSISAVMSLKSGASFYIIEAPEVVGGDGLYLRPKKKASINCYYRPYVGTVVSGITPPDEAQPTLGAIPKLYLQYPPDAPTETVILRNPEFGNTDRLEFQRINRYSRGGTLLIYADPNWPKQQTMSISISSLSQNQKNNLVDFLTLTLGKEIKLVDHENRAWRGIITTPDAEITNEGLTCRYSVSFEFEGELM